MGYDGGMFIGPTLPPKDKYTPPFEVVLVDLSALPGREDHTDPERYSAEGYHAALFSDGTSAVITKRSIYTVKLENKS